MKDKVIAKLIATLKINDSHYVPTYEELEGYTIKELSGFLEDARA